MWVTNNIYLLLGSIKVAIAFTGLTLLHWL